MTTGRLRIGIDLDNTLVCYERLFAELAREHGLPATAANRIELRDRLRLAGQEDLWTEMQGEAYGPRMRDAEPFAGALDFVERCAADGAEIFIVSHRTPYPYRGARHDLHAAARDWLARHGFVGTTRIAIDNVFLEVDRPQKLGRIVALRLTHFIDDLPEVLADEQFPRATTQILFDPGGAWSGTLSCARASSWDDVGALIFDAGDRGC